MKQVQQLPGFAPDLKSFTATGGHSQIMIEQWLIDRLNPLKSESLVILADPQRMIRAGARAVGCLG